jgi:DNA helicase-2/ATP-dependent DNA helicase PcrA
LFVINELIKKQQDLNISQMLETIIQMTNYDKHLQSLDFEDRVPNIEELTVAIKEYELQNPHGKIVDYLNEISLYTDNEKNVRNTNGITLMTVHTAKGSEYYAVFVIAFNEGVFPSFKSQDLQEERRIAYVALTRAKKILYLSASQFDNIQGNNMTLSPSRFINEISKSYLEFQQANLINDSYKYTYQPINNHYKVGSIIKHVVFGVGVVISCEKNFITVSFKAPYGVKTLLGDHKAIRKIKN